MHATVMVSVFEIGSDGRTAFDRSRDKPFSVSACSKFRWTEHGAERRSWMRSSSMECFSD